MKLNRQIPVESLVSLRQRLDTLPARCTERRQLIESNADLFGVSVDTLYRALRECLRPPAAHRSDRGKPRKLPAAEMERCCEVIAAFKIRTLNKKGRHVSTVRAIEILERFGMHTPDGVVRLPVGTLTASTVNRYLKLWGYDHSTLTRESPAARFQAEFSNQCWHFDLSPSDLKHLAKPPAWVEPGRGDPTLMIYSIVDDRSGACYQEYRCVYGEDTEAALRFLFNAMSAKSIEGFSFQGIPEMLYMDNGPISKSRVFLNVMECLGIEVATHQPKGAIERKTTARAKGKVERPFRTVKEAHETLYHFHQPTTEAEANQWLHQYLLNYNEQQHREENHSRLNDWRQNAPADGIKEMCGWERFSQFAREPQRAKVGNDARITSDGIAYEVEPDLAGETVILWWGLFDRQLFVEFNERRYGPFEPVGSLSSLPRYRKFRKTKTEERADRIGALAKLLDLPRAALEGNRDLEFSIAVADASIVLPTITPFRDSDPFREFAYPNAVAAKLAIAAHMGQSLMKLAAEQRLFINELVAETLNKKAVIERVDRYFYPARFSTAMELPRSEVSLENLENLEEKGEYVN